MWDDNRLYERAELDRAATNVPCLYEFRKRLKQNSPQIYLMDKSKPEVIVNNDNSLFNPITDGIYKKSARLYVSQNYCIQLKINDIKNKIKNSCTMSWI